MELPSDLLCDIFRLVDDTSAVDQKYKLSQVCVYWRAVALEAPLLWSSLTLFTPLDVHRLPSVFARSRDLPLDITLPKNSWIVDNKAAVDLLTGQRDRIRRLHVQYDDERHCFLGRLLCQGFTFSLLEDLELSRSPYSNGRLTLFISAPRLRSLHLTRTDCDRYHGLLVPSLQHLFLDDCRLGLGAGLLAAVFARSEQLRTLTCRAMFNKVDVSHDDYVAFKPGGCLPYLRTFRVDVAVSSRFLRFVFGTRILQEMEIYTAEGEIDATMQELFSHVFRGLEKLVELRFDSEEESWFEIRDGTGRVRRVSVLPYAVHPWRFRDLWTELVQQCNIAASLETIYTSTCHWNDVVSAFASRPPEGRIELHVKLVVGIPGDFYGGPGGDSPLQLKCPNLVKVVFHDFDDHPHRGHRTTLAFSVITQLLPCITSTARSISLCASKAGLATSGGTETLSALRAQLPEQFVFCGHCDVLCRDHESPAQSTSRGYDYLATSDLA
ncbi:hypothetical protein EXIGLDRAFT_838246 [Exidia glandulosa HHB12029]|uniref:F-box domain-containing protein n=1 Tax=Exidia glandulosa HHB12029 TaxID=1314781 RepID=A0A165G058_EXIGL|nr:hypothetical protein EXIGLDRAFT_838246 [Exidia glandulosa HHB12029]